MPDYLDRHDPDPLRYMLSAIMPETSDSDFTWAEYVRRNNDELVATWGNLVNRVLTFTRRNFDGRVPDVSPGLSPQSRAILEKVDRAFETAAGHIEAVQMRAALQAAMSVAQETNRYLDERAPWAAIKADRASAAETLFTAVNVISGLATLLQPFMPFTSPHAWEMAGNVGDIEAAGWRRTDVPAGAPLPEPAPLFKKLDDSLVEEEEARLGS
jgi:methionyl-tRNA synthetase